MARPRQTEEDKEFLKMVGRNVKFYRINHNCTDTGLDSFGRISQEKLAEMAGVSVSMISGIEATNVAQPTSISLLRKIAKAVNVPLYAFFLEKPIKNPPKDPFEEKDAR